MLKTLDFRSEVAAVREKGASVVGADVCFMAWIAASRRGYFGARRVPRDVRP